MPFFNRFPWTNFHELNLDWILEKLHEIAGTFIIKSVNNVLPDESGNVEITVDNIPDAGKVKTVNNKQPDNTGNVDVGTVKSINSNFPDSAGAVSIRAINIPGCVRAVNMITPDETYGNVDVGTVKSVNNTTPDANGNVNLPTAAGVTSVNDVGADGDGNVELTPADIGAIDENDLDYKKWYNSVTELGLTAGSATIAGVWNALSNGERITCNASQFDADNRPSVGGEIDIFRIEDDRGWIEFKGRQGIQKDFRMFLDAATPAQPTGVWMNCNTEYFPGDSIVETLTSDFVGHITGAGARVYGYYKPPKSLKNITNMTLLNMTGTIRGVNGYIDSHQDNTVWDLEVDTVTVNKRGDNTIIFRYDPATAIPAINNTPVVWTVLFTISLS